MLEKLKRRALRKHTERFLKNRDTSQVNDKLITLGVLVDESLYSDFDHLYDFTKVLGLHPKDIRVFSFLEVKKRLPSIRQNQINNKDFNWKGEIQNQNALEFLDTKFDVLLALYDKPHVYLDMMVSKSKAKFKVGFQELDMRLFDLILNVKPSEIKLVESEMKKYIILLNKK